MVDGDEAEIDATADRFLDVPWWTVGRPNSSAKDETPAFAGMGTGEGEDDHDLAAILRRALMDLSAALQDIERQLTSIPEDGAAPRRG